MNFKIFTIGIIIVIVLKLLGIFDVLDNRIYDYLIVSNQSKSQSSKIVIIEIDSKSIKQIGKWPWRRAIYIDFLKKIISAKPKVIGLDISFTDSQGYPEEDQELYALLKSFKKTVIVPKLKYDKLRLLIPEKSLFPEIKQGHVLFSDKDIIRAFPPFKTLPAFSLMVFKLYSDNDSFLKGNLHPKLASLLNKTNGINYSINQDLLIDYKRQKNYFKHISFSDILNNNYEKKDLENKIVLIGITDKYLIPFFPTPYSIQKSSFSSSTIELQAQIIDSLFHFRNLEKCPALLVYIISILFAVLFFLITNNKNFVYKGVVFSFLIVLLSLSCFLSFKYVAFWFPPTMLYAFIIIIFGLQIYTTVNQVDYEIVKTLESLHKDDNTPLLEIPSNINHKIDLLKSFMHIVVSDRKTIKAIMNGVNNGIIVLNSSGNIVWSNGRFLDYFQNKLILDSNISEVIEDLIISDIKNVIENDNVYKKEINVNNIDLLCIINPIDTQKNQFVAIFNDITDLKKLDRLKTDMIRMVSHELKTPLMNIMLAVEEAQEAPEKELFLKNSIIISNSASNMMSTITNFLNLNKLENNLMELTPDNYKILDIIEKCIDLQMPLAETKNVNCIIENQCDPVVSIDNKLFEIAFNNLLSNAIKYSHNNNNVYIIITDKKTTIEVAIKDSGIGIPEHEIALITQKFYRSQAEENSRILGTGLGLSIVSKILSMHQTELVINSKYGEGSTFSFELPIITS